MIDCYADVDAQSDPDPDKARPVVSRVRGPSILIKPPRTKGVSQRVARWMVNPELLATNPHWLTTDRVAKNGKAWGDEEDPEEEEERLKVQRLADLQGRKRSRTVTVDDGRRQELKEKEEEILGGISLDELF